MNSGLTFPVALWTSPLGLTGTPHLTCLTANPALPPLRPVSRLHANAQHAPWPLAPTRVQTSFLLTWTGTTASQAVSLLPPFWSTFCIEARKNLWKCKSNHITPEFKTFRGSPPPLQATFLPWPTRPYKTWPRPGAYLPQDLISSHSLPSLAAPQLTGFHTVCYPSLQGPRAFALPASPGMVSPDICLMGSPSCMALITPLTGPTPPHLPLSGCLPYRYLADRLVCLTPTRGTLSYWFLPVTSTTSTR